MDIFISREDVMSTAIDEIVNLEGEYDPRLPLCVNFHGEGRCEQ